MLVSFIIPSYNSAQTVRRCLESIYALSLKQEEFEVIFIDDASTDNTIEIVEAYSQHCSTDSHRQSDRAELFTHKEKGAQNLKLLKQPKNNRQGAARNRGLSIAKGEYICFVDSDDAVTEGVVSAVRQAKELNTDMTAYHHAFVNENGQQTKEADRLSFAPGKIFSGIEMHNKHPYWCSGPVAYIYNREFLKKTNYPFQEGMLYEDSDFVAVHLYYAKRMTYSPELGYMAYYREGSTTRSTSYKNAADYLLLGTRMLAFYEQITGERMNELGNERIRELKNEGVNELKSEREAFAESILQGACWNVTKATNKMLYKLKGIQELKAFYNRVDLYTNRSELYANPHIHRYFWNARTSLCIRHKYLSIALNACLSLFYQLYVMIRR